METNPAIFPADSPVLPMAMGIFLQNMVHLPIDPGFWGHPMTEVIFMNSKRHQQRITEDLRLDPESRLCPAFDCTSIKLFAAPDEGEMGFRVLDNCAEENMR